jgi:hypothetical protein
MTQAINGPDIWEARRQQWMARVEAEINQIEGWAHAQGWSTARAVRNMNERMLGEYTVPVLRVRLPVGEVNVIPVALNVIGADGRIDIEAFPALNRVKLIGRGTAWEIYTDSNVPLRRPWNAETFVQLAQDLTA